MDWSIVHDVSLVERKKIEIPGGVKKKESVGEEAEFPFDISPMYEGERVRKGDMYVELGGTSQPGFELVIVLSWMYRLIVLSAVGIMVLSLLLHLYRNAILGFGTAFPLDPTVFFILVSGTA